MADGARFRAPLCVATALLVTGMRKQETCHFPDHSMDFLSFSFHLAHNPSATNSKEEQSENIQQYLMQRILVQSGWLSQPNRHLPAQLPILFRFFPLPSYVAIIYKLCKQGLWYITILLLGVEQCTLHNGSGRFGSIYGILEMAIRLLLRTEGSSLPLWLLGMTMQLSPIIFLNQIARCICTWTSVLHSLQKLTTVSNSGSCFQWR